MPVSCLTDWHYTRQGSLLFYLAFYAQKSTQKNYFYRFFYFPHSKNPTLLAWGLGLI
ncbi:Uncharacterised protein [Yersinia enterocolitica subsp. enterocolitica]|nr:Uncharacterised protein [Yersinia enterocolitica subsp. enterocolitica]